MLFKSAIITQGSGSVGGWTMSRNRGGMYLRARAVPTNPNTARQAFARQILGIFSTRWNTLTADQRNGWETYAANVSMINKLGDAVFLTGQQHYIRSNTARNFAPQLFLAVDDAPTTFNLGTPGVIGLTSVTASSGDVIITFDDADNWVDEPNSILAMSIGRPQNQGVSYYKSPWSRYELVTGNATTPPSSPLTTTVVYQPLTTGQRVWVKAVLCRADGRVSEPIILGPTTVL